MRSAIDTDPTGTPNAGLPKGLVILCALAFLLAITLLYCAVVWLCTPIVEVRGGRVGADLEAARAEQPVVRSRLSHLIAQVSTTNIVRRFMDYTKTVLSHCGIRFHPVTSPSTDHPMGGVRQVPPNAADQLRGGSEPTLRAPSRNTNITPPLLRPTTDETPAVPEVNGTSTGCHLPLGRPPDPPVHEATP